MHLKQVRRHLTYKLIGFFKRSLSLTDGGLPGFARYFRYRVQLLSQVGLDELKLCFVRAEKLRTGIGIEGVRHLAGRSAREKGISLVLELE